MLVRVNPDPSHMTPDVTGYKILSLSKLRWGDNFIESRSVCKWLKMEPKMTYGILWAPSTVRYVGMTEYSQFLHDSGHQRPQNPDFRDEATTTKKKTSCIVFW